MANIGRGRPAASLIAAAALAFSGGIDDVQAYVQQVNRGMGVTQNMKVPDRNWDVKTFERPRRKKRGRK